MTEAGGTLRPSVSDTVIVSESLSLQLMREYVVKQLKWVIALVAVNFLNSSLGLVIQGWTNVIVSLLLSLTAFYIGLRAIIKVKEIRTS